jgi:hypothetical protein
MATYQELTDGRPDGAHVGQNASDLVAFHGAAPVDQYAFVADQSILALISGSVVGFTTSASFSSAITTINTILALLREKGLMAAS